jgi:hypothetical protein
MITLIPRNNKKLLERNVCVAFINPPHADWSLANNAAYLMFQSHYKRYGKYPHKIEWLKAPYKFNLYETVQDIYEDGIQNADIYLFSSLTNIKISCARQFKLAISIVIVLTLHSLHIVIL